MLRTEDLSDSIKNHRNTEEVIHTIISDFDYYNSLLMDGTLKIQYKKINTRTTFLGLAALYANNEVLHGLLKEGVSADGLDFFLYRESIRNEGNYRASSPYTHKRNPWGFPLDQKCWSTITEILDELDDNIISISWSTPVILAILSENATGLELLLQYGASCDLRHPYYADALSLCDSREVMDVLGKYPGTHMKEAIADVLTVFNFTLAEYLFDLGIKPNKDIIKKINERYRVTSRLPIGKSTIIDVSSKLWESFYKKRAEACMEFYFSKGY